MKWVAASVSDYKKDEYSKVYASLSPSRKSRVDRYKREEDRTRSLLCEILLRRLLADSGEEKAVLETAENGKPFLKNSSLFISMSHSYEMGVCVLSDKAIGIDIEKIRPINLALIDRVCIEEEKEYVLSNASEIGDIAENSSILERFYEVWTAKEAYFKKIGTGITDLKSVNILRLQREVIKLGDYIIGIV